MKVVEYFQSRPHETVSNVVERDREIQKWKKQRLPKVLLGWWKVARDKHWNIGGV